MKTRRTVCGIHCTVRRNKLQRTVQVVVDNASLARAGSAQLLGFWKWMRVWSDDLRTRGSGRYKGWTLNGRKIE